MVLIAILTDHLVFCTFFLGILSWNPVQYKCGLSADENTLYNLFGTGQFAGISTADLRAVLQDVEKRYPNNEAAQLEYIADAFLGFYKEASIGFPSDVRKKPHHQVLDKL